MTEDASEHFTEEQIKGIKRIFHNELNSFLLKIVGINAIFILTSVFAAGGAWWNLLSVQEHIEEYAKKEYVDYQISQIDRRIDSNAMRLERIEEKIDRILERI